MRILKLMFFCIAVFIASTPFAYSADYALTLLSPNFKLRNHLGAQLSASQTFIKTGQ